ncbi:hypothetical protein AB0G04_28705 [Actinoplanes sp. NPDC023801]|uniref:hypothetical protein n=1 Tax=Actinoplanes sp. NPDC023801 TaxID=3154595 RepID=UPI0033FEAAB0
MGETHVPEEPKKIHGDKLAEAFREPREAEDQPRAEDLPRHPASRTKEKTRSGTRSGHSR